MPLKTPGFQASLQFLVKSGKFILVQLPEPTTSPDYPTIVDITKERVRRVGQQLQAKDAKELSFTERTGADEGFRTFTLAESNFLTWEAFGSTDTEALEQKLELHVDHIREGRSDQDLLYELLLKSGYPLTTAVEVLTLEGKTVYSVANGDLLVCLERGLTLKLIRAMAARQPARVVFLDAGFAGNDQLKTNAAQTFKTKGVTSFKTV